jgi:tRNA G18 (ribose-2'-O)-methylase SpoU
MARQVDSLNVAAAGAVLMAWMIDRVDVPEL